MFRPNLISIIIPCYNAANFILDTLQSILSQKNVEFELIIIDDGSTDNSEQLIKSLMDNRIYYYFQANSGVSSARNAGLEKAKGIYIVFFDADDLMSEDFLSSRKQVLEGNLQFDFVCGKVEKFNEKGIIEGFFKGPGATNLNEEILLYQKDVITCPSNFMFRSKFLRKNGIEFNCNLSSTADRYFLLVCRSVGQNFYDSTIPCLYYRVNSDSMSNNFSKFLVRDNELFYNEIKKNNLIPAKIKNKSLSFGYFILSAANYKINNYYFAIKFSIIAFFYGPVEFMKKVLNR
jgi:glycosyltransferase involved in cell wall biosynthesis